MPRRGEARRARGGGAAAGAARLAGAAARALFARKAPGFRWGLAASLTLHAALLLAAVAGAPAPAARRVTKDEKVYVVNLASLPRAGAGVLATEAAPKGQEPRPTTQRMKRPEEEKKKPEINLGKPKKKPAKKEEKPKPVPTDKVATKSVEPAPVGSRDGAKGASGGALGIPGGGSGIGLSGTGTDSDFPFTYYLIAVRNKIALRWSPPRGVSAGGAALRVTLHFRILRGGTVTDLEVEQASGVDFYDQSAVRAVQAAMPLPPLPEEFPDEYLGVHFDFQFVE
jgi:TonB family protein